MSLDPAATSAGSPPTAAKQLLELALQHVSEPPAQATNPRREFRVDVLRSNRLHLYCRGESAEVADELCIRASKDGVAQIAGARIDARERAIPAWGRRLRDSTWPALLLGLGWFLVRTRFLRRIARPKRAADSAAALEGQRWSVPPRPAPSSSAVSAVPPALPRLPGMQPTARAQLNGTRRPSTPARTQNMLDPQPRAWAQLASSTPYRAADPLVAIDVNGNLERYQHPEEIAPALPEPTGRVIYHVGTGPWLADDQVLTAAPLEQLRALRDQLARDAGTGCRVIRVASGASSRYAKSQVAAQLAWLLAEQKTVRVLLMEADLDAPALHKVIRVNVPRGFGFSEQLERLGDVSGSSSAVTRLRVGARLEALVEGRWGTPTLFDSPQFSAVLSQERHEHDVIVVDGPVVDDCPDTKALTGAADGVVFVVASGTALEESMRLFSAHFERMGMVRVVMTGHWPNA